MSFDRGTHVRVEHTFRDRLHRHPGVRVEGSAPAPAGARAAPGGARSGARHRAVVGTVTAAAEAAGVRPGMRLGEALATCPELVLVEQDPETAEQAWEEILQRLEDRGFAVEPVEPGCVYFDTRGVERLYGGLEPALKRALEAVGSQWDGRAGAADRRFAALAAASVARPGQVLIVSDGTARDFLAPLPLTLLPLERERYEELEELGVRESESLPRFRAAPWPSGWGRTAGAPGVRRGERRTAASAPGGHPSRSSRCSSSRRRSGTS